MLLAATLVSAPVGLADSASTRQAELVERPSLVAPIVLVAAGGLLSLGGTGLTLLGVSLAGLQASCAAGVDCQGNIHRIAGALIVGGVVLLAGGLVMAILGHIKWATRAEQRADLLRTDG